ncbi:MAG: AmmeMemoRadiSam system protein A [Synergistaceae bacterium]|jgi:AmmeMemoRadiSam system protein A|nr:AmmeMemoRadiSam system protein A [Synergistaceae bacterium]
MTDIEKNHPYVVLARRTVERYLGGGIPPAGGLEIDPRAELWNIRRACFVSIKTTSGDLRGCIGTILPARPSLDVEIIENAVSSSTRDPRFPPMKKAELDNVVFSVDVLSEPEKIPDKSMLDVKKWGVIVSNGTRRGVLLPDLEGVDTVDGQIEIASRKAGIYDTNGITLERFSVRRYPEK